jgi:predicted RNase H-like nuclease (RuvC/YqgF family)
MSAHNQGDGVSSAGAAAAPAPSAGEGQESKQHALEEKVLKLEAEIEQLKTEIASDKAEIKQIKSETERLQHLELLGKDKDRLMLLEARRDMLRQEIKELSAPGEQPTAARGRSPTLCQPLRSRIVLLASQGIARAPLATRI